MTEPVTPAEGRTIVITAEHREALREAILLDLTGVGDIASCLRYGKWDEAQRFHRRFENDMRLLDDLGWAWFDPRTSYPLTAPIEQLEGTARRLKEDAEAALKDHSAGVTGWSRAPAEQPAGGIAEKELSEERQEVTQLADEDLDTILACSAILEQLEQLESLTPDGASH